MGRVGKKIALVLGIIASILIIGTSVSGWVQDYKNKNDDTTGTEQTAAVAVIDA